MLVAIIQYRKIDRASVRRRMCASGWPVCYPARFPAMNSSAYLAAPAMSTMKTTLYGIPNCDTVKKARAWLAAQGHDVDFHDFKKHGLERATVAAWLERLDWEVLVNRRGTTWRKLSDVRRAGVVDKASALELMLEMPSVIKRPVLAWAGMAGMAHMAGTVESISVGFSERDYAELFGRPAPP